MAQPLTTPQLQALAEANRGHRGCATCAVLVCPGWEALPPGFDERRLRPLGTLRAGGTGAEADDGGSLPEPTWAEHHPQGTRTDSPLAPIAPAWHPYNRSDVAACVACGRAYLRYTEFGGYYVEHRIRLLDPDRLVP